MSLIFAALRARTRSFHTPFALLGNAPLTHPPANLNISSQYEKQYDHRPEPTTSHSGYRTYVVSEPDVAIKHYQVPAGAYPASAPYTTADERHTSSTGGEQPTHTTTPRGRSELADKERTKTDNK